MSATQDLKCLDDLNATLDKIIEYAENSLSTLSDFEDDVQEKAQEQVDKICEKVSNKATAKLNEARDKTVASLNKKYTSVNAVVSNLKPIVEAQLTDLGSVISTLTNIIALYAKPYKTALDYTVGFIGVATPKLLETTEKIAKLANLKKQAPIPDGLDINLNKLNITMKPITINDITGG